MSDLSAFPITAKWPSQHPDRIQLYSLPTPNGVKVSVMLEETGLPYEVHAVRFHSNDQFSREFRSPPRRARLARRPRACMLASGPIPSRMPRDGSFV